jgi:hypothetical protein
MNIPKRKYGEPLRSWCRRLATENDGISSKDLEQLLIAVSEESYSQGGDDQLIAEAQIDEEL